jgi:hypothetical protein
MAGADVTELKTDILIVGGGLGGVSAALAAASLGASVVLVEELDWLGGQLTAQGIPLDEYPWNETVVFSRTYFEFRSRIRQFYRDHYPLTAQAKADPLLNPGMGNVSTIAHEPRVAVQVIEAMLSPYAGSGRLRILRRHKVLSVAVASDRISGIVARNLNSGRDIAIACQTMIDATETGDMLELAKIEHVLGAESQATTGEPHAVAGDTDPLNQPGVTWAFAADYLPGESHVIDRPASYTRWRDGVLAPWTSPRFTWTIPDHVTHQLRQRPLFAGDTDEEYVFDLWHARRIAWRRNFEPGTYASDITLACWPQIEYWDKPALGVSVEAAETALRESRELSLSFVHWIQTEAPRHDGGQGYPGLRLRGDVLGTDDGLAKQVYWREGRRIKAETTLLEQHIAVDARKEQNGAERFDDAIAIVAYRIDLHYSTRGNNTIDIDTYPFQIPLGALLPVRVENFLPGCKNLGTTRITNGACRVHPAEWSIGETSGALAVFAARNGVPPRGVRSNAKLRADFQALLKRRGALLEWPVFGPLTATARIGYRPPPKS